jgi:hypothetical protein
MAQPGGAHAGFKALGFPACDLAVDKQSKPFGVARLSTASPHLAPVAGESFRRNAAARPLNPSSTNI